MAIFSDVASFGVLDLSYQAGMLAMLKNDQPWTPRSFFDPPRINAPELVEFGVGKTYDFFA